MYSTDTILAAQYHLREASDQALIAYHTRYNPYSTGYNERRMVEELRKSAKLLGFELSDPVDRLFATAERVTAIDAEDRDS